MILGFYRAVSLFCVLAGTALLGACTTVTEPAMPTYLGRQPEKPTGFFGRLADSFSERECYVGRFTCPYGLGPAGEPCECVAPDGVVYKGNTVK
jgi:hypothetical protein